MRLWLVCTRLHSPSDSSMFSEWNILYVCLNAILNVCLNNRDANVMNNGWIYFLSWEKLIINGPDFYQTTCLTCYLGKTGCLIKIRSGDHKSLCIYNTKFVKKIWLEFTDLPTLGYSFQKEPFVCSSEEVLGLKLYLKRLLHKCVPVNIAKFLRTVFL